jgi:hypothetical protein
MDEREQLLRNLERYRTLLGYTTDEQAIAAIEQLIMETRNRLDRLETREITVAKRLPCLVVIRQKDRDRGDQLRHSEGFRKHRNPARSASAARSSAPEITIDYRDMVSDANFPASSSPSPPISRQSTTTRSGRPRLKKLLRQVWSESMHGGSSGNTGSTAWANT